MSVLTQCQLLGIGTSVIQQLQTIIVAGGELDPHRERKSFTQALLSALDEFDAVLSGSGGVLCDVALELLLHFVFAHLESDERSQISSIDHDKAAALFRDHAVRAIGVRPAQPAEESERGDNLEQAFTLPQNLAHCEDLTCYAKSSERLGRYPFDGAHCYEQLFDTIGRVFFRHQTRHVLLVGERGVGKSIVLAEFARRAAFGIYPFLVNKHIVTVDCRHVAPDESRPKLAAILAYVANRQDLIICFDGFPQILRGERLASNKATLLYGLCRAHCRVVGMLTPRDYEEFIADDPDYAEFFVRIDVPEPEVDVAIRLLDHFAGGLGQRFGIAIDSEAVRQAILLSSNFILNDQLPAKAMKVLVRACENKEYERVQLGRAHERVTPDDVLAIVAELTGVPEETLRGVAGQVDYEQSLHKFICGQDHAVKEVAKEIGLIKAGMTDPNKPASVLLFLGQTGTGKTEMAKVLARLYSTTRRLKTYTLGNCVEPHSVSTIIGVPPGYVGHDQGGRLINDLNSDPYCVFLLDEVDKAHPDVLQPFLNLFDEGWVSDQRGVRALANRSIFVLTTNVGQRLIAQMTQEGKPSEEIASRMKEALSQIRHTKSDRPVFTPEFLARIKRVIVFNPLDHTAMVGISERQLEELRETWLSKRSKSLKFQPQIVRLVADEAHKLNSNSSGKEGGRIVRKLISDWIESRLQREVSQNPDKYHRSQTIMVSCSNSIGGECPGGISPCIELTIAMS